MSRRTLVRELRQLADHLERVDLQDALGITADEFRGNSDDYKLGGEAE